MEDISPSQKIKLDSLMIKRKEGEIKVKFGPHHFLEIKYKDNKTTFIIGATHHGVKFDASEVNGELYNAIELLRKEFPNNIID